MSTDTVVVGSETLKCVTRDGQEHKLPGPPNMPNGDHRACMRFSIDGGIWSVTFRKFDNSDRWGEISAEKNLPAIRYQGPVAPPVDRGQPPAE